MINEYHFDKLVVGGSLESLLYCFINNCKMVLTSKLYPLEVETISYHDSARLLGYETTKDICKSEMWDRLSFVLSMTGLVVIPNNITSTRTIDGGIVVITEHNKRVKLFSEQILRFDNIDDDRFKMIDWFDVRSGNNHRHVLLEAPKDNFINKVFFYTSKRVGRNINMKDIFAISDVNRKEAYNVNHGEGIARLKILNMMKEAGIKGQSNGFNKKGKRQHFALKIEHTHRQLRAVYSPQYNLDQLLAQEPPKEAQWAITRKLFRHKQISTLQESFRLPASL